MQRIFTEENAQERQQNIEDLTSTLDAKHRQIGSVQSGNNENDESLLKSIHEISKETVNELKEMRKQLDEERRINTELRRKMRRKNRQLKVLSYNNKLAENEDDDDDDRKENEYKSYIPPMAYDPNAVSLKNERRHLSLDSIDTDYSLSDDKPSTFESFQNWCMNMGFTGKKTKCSWF